ncbi:hypothetical protein PMAYCL1PPCAC_21284, partial [Pristionchus mayeri]
RKSVAVLILADTNTYRIRCLRHKNTIRSLQVSLRLCSLISKASMRMSPSAFMIAELNGFSYTPLPKSSSTRVPIREKGEKNRLNLSRPIASSYPKSRYWRLIKNEANTIPISVHSRRSIPITGENTHATAANDMNAIPPPTSTFLGLCLVAIPEYSHFISKSFHRRKCHPSVGANDFLGSLQPNSRMTSARGHAFPLSNHSWGLPHIDRHAQL